MALIWSQAARVSVMISGVAAIWPLLMFVKDRLKIMRESGDIVELADATGTFDGVQSAKDPPGLFLVFGIFLEFDECAFQFRDQYIGFFPEGIAEFLDMISTGSYQCS